MLGKLSRLFASEFLHQFYQLVPDDPRQLEDMPGPKNPGPRWMRRAVSPFIKLEALGLGVRRPEDFEVELVVLERHAIQVERVRREKLPL